MTKSDLLLIWDSNEKPPLEFNNIILWQSYDTENNQVSIPKLVEDNAESLKLYYLNMVHSLGGVKINGKRVTEYLKIRSGFSYWWMTLIVEQCNYSKSPQINNIIKLIAFKKWLNTEKNNNIVLFSNNESLARSVQLLATSLGANFNWHKNIQSDRVGIGHLKEIYQKLPHYLHGFLWLVRYIINRRLLIGVGVDNWKKSSATTTFASYLFHIDRDFANKGMYKSDYWSKLPDLLCSNGIKSNWLHIYVKSSLLPTVRSARDKIKEFNKTHSGTQSRVVLESFLNLSVVKKTIQDYFYISKSRKSVGAILKYECGYLWPLFMKDFNISLTGRELMNNLLFYYLFKRAMSLIIKQNKGFYLLENQGWESAFIDVWRSSGSAKKLIGVVHSTTRYWDLRYSKHSKFYELVGKYGNDIPCPDFIAVNSKEAKYMYINNGCPNDKVIEVEALRYLHLEHKNEKLYSKVYDNTVLIFGDYLDKHNVHMMRLLQRASYYIDREIRYLIKPHLNCPISVEDYPELNITLTNTTISTLIEKYSVAYTGIATTASVDAYCKGNLVITALNPEYLNLSPLRLYKDVEFIKNPKELAAILNNINFKSKECTKYKDYFYINPNIPKWKLLLEIFE